MVSLHPTKAKIANICKGLVNHHGWTDQVLLLSCEQAGFSPAASRGLFPNGIIEVAEDLMKEWESRIAIEVRLQDIQEKTMGEQVFYVLKQRLLYESDFMPRWKEAMLLGLYPQNIFTTYDRLYYTMNTVCDIIGDKSVGADWYLKRALVGKIFVCSETFMTNDESEGFEATWRFLEKEVKGLRQETFESFGSVGGWTLEYLLRSVNLKE